MKSKQCWNQQRHNNVPHADARVGADVDFTQSTGRRHGT